MGASAHPGYERRDAYESVLACAVDADVGGVVLEDEAF